MRCPPPPPLPEHHSAVYAGYVLSAPTVPSTLACQGQRRHRLNSCPPRTTSTAAAEAATPTTTTVTDGGVRRGSRVTVPPGCPRLGTRHWGRQLRLLKRIGLSAEGDHGAIPCAANTTPPHPVPRPSRRRESLAMYQV